MRVKDYVLNLKKGSGLTRATYIAENLMKSTDPRHWDSLPHGEIFFTKDRKGNIGMNTKALLKNHAFWKEAYHLLKKMKF